MRKWISYLADASPVRAIYGSDCPDLELISLHELVLHRDGPRAVLRFDLKEFPNTPPKKWAAAGYNTVQVVLTAYRIEHLSILGWGTNVTINLEIQSDGSLIRLLGVGEAVKFEFIAAGLRVDKISAYRDGEQ